MPTTSSVATTASTSKIGKKQKNFSNSARISKKLRTFAPANPETGCSAVGSALRSGRRGRAFESPHPDRNGKTGLQEVTDVQPLLFFESVMICLHINLSPSLNLLECLCIKGFEHGRDEGFLEVSCSYSLSEGSCRAISAFGLSIKD